MKASDSVKNYPSRLREYANYSLRSIKRVCKDIGPRFPGSDGEKKAHDYFFKELEGCCDTVVKEEFAVHPRAFLGWVPLCCYMAVIGCVLFYFGLAAVTLALAAVALLLIVLEFVFYRQPLDPFYPKKTSANVIGVKNPSGEIKRKFIFSGHCDSSGEWTYTYLGGPVLLKIVLFAGVGGLVLLLAAVVAAFVNGYALGFTLEGPQSPFVNVVRYVLLGYIPVFLAASRFSNPKKPVLGANDDLTGCFAAVSAAKFLTDCGLALENTQLNVLITGSEEAGLRGAKDFAKRHAGEYKEVPTMFLGIDTLRDYDDMAVYTRDMSGTVKNGEQACALLREGAANAGLNLPCKTITLGSSDAAAITQAGLQAAALAAMDPAPARYYHTRLDNETNLDLKTIEAGINVCLETMFLFDEKGFG